MTAGFRGWLLSLIAVSILCAIADALMPAGGPRRVGKLLCGLVLLCAVLTPLTRLELAGSEGWLEDWRAGLEREQEELAERAGEVSRSVIEARCAAYIVDKAARMGLPPVEVRVTCRAAGDGVYLPDRAEIAGALSPGEREALSAALREELDLPEDQIAYREENVP